jgi:pyruvate dehydrogenase E2 component (dihydrolipoamide acetyltransferase)
MGSALTMPRLSDQMEEGVVLQWLKAAGDEVKKGDPVVEIETDKTTWVVESEDDGFLLEILVPAGGSAPVGGTIAFVGVEGETAAAIAAPARDLSAPAPAGGRSRATPVARRTAEELQVALANVVGTGTNGRIVRRDVVAAAHAQPSVAPPAHAIRGEPSAAEFTHTQRTIARRMLESTTTIPHFALTAEIDMEAAVALRIDLQKLLPDAPPSLNDLVVKAVALALRDHPRLNASWEDGRVVAWPRVNVGIAVATDDALLVPVVVDADRKPLGELARESRNLVERAQQRALTPAEVSGGTFTVSNLGMFGIRMFSAVINPPEAAILAVGEVARRATVSAADEVVVRQQMTVTLSSDHRIVYGAEGAAFLARVRALLERPLALAF